MIDPFAGGGHFLLTAARSNILSMGSELNEEMFKMAIDFGCQDMNDNSAATDKNSDLF